MALLGNLKHTLVGWARHLVRDNRAFVRGYFEHLYRSPDPYATAADPEEQHKRQAALAALKRLRFRTALEIGGGEGLLTAPLADHVDSLLMVDLSQRALDRANARLHAMSNVRTARLDVVAKPLPGTFDLIVCSEVLFYVPIDDLSRVKNKILDGLEDDGRLLLVHSRSAHDDEQGLEYKDFGAKTIHDLFADDPRVRIERDDIFDMFRVTLLHKTSDATGH